MSEPGSNDRSVPLEERLELLAGVPAFAHLPPAVLEELASRPLEERFQSGDTVVVEGGAGDRLYLIVEGRAEASTTEPSGTIPLATLEQGELFGEIALLEPGGRRQATVRATEPLLALSLDAPNC